MSRFDWFVLGWFFNGALVALLAVLRERKRRAVATRLLAEVNGHFARMQEALSEDRNVLRPDFRAKQKEWKQ